MGIKSIKTFEAGLVGVKPKIIYIDTDDSLAEVKSVGYLNKAKPIGFTFSNNEIALIKTSSGVVFLDVTLKADGNIVLTSQPSQKVSFSAYQSVVQTIPNTAFTKVIFDTSTFNLGSSYDSGLGRFKPTVAGVYVTSAKVKFATWVSGIRSIISIYKNGVLYERTTSYPATTSTVTAQISAHMEMNGTTDYAEVFIHQTTGATVDLSAASTDTVFSGILLS